MTRGKIIYIDKYGLSISNEFNGDMYLEGHGNFIKEGLFYINNTRKFYKFVSLFNDLAHSYDDIYFTTVYPDEEKRKDVYIKEGKTVIDFTKDYFTNWFSDYLYFKLDVDTTFITEKGKVEKKKGDVVVFNFGVLEE